MLEQLIEVGFIQITYEGGMTQGDMNKYRLLWIEGIPHTQMRWKRYPNENWKHECLAKKIIWLEELRALKSNSTLKSKTLNGTISPNELDPSKVISPND